MNNRAYLLLGGDKGDCRRNIIKAISMLAGISDTTPVVSPVFESDPWGFMSNTKFLNVAVIITTESDAYSLLEELHNIEKILGRERDGAESDSRDGSGNKGGYSSREMDIDIIFFNNDIINNKALTVPHPRMHLRRFVLEPLNVIAPDFIHPLFNKSVNRLLKECKDESSVVPVEFNIRSI